MPKPFSNRSLAASLLNPSAKVSPALRLDRLCGIDEDAFGCLDKGEAGGGGDGDGVIVRPVVDLLELNPSVGVGRLWNSEREVERVASWTESRSGQR